MHLNQWIVVVVCSVGATSAAQFNGQTVAARKSRAADFVVPIERSTLPNGLVVLLSPDDGTNEVAIELSFGCGALRQPANLAGLPHVVEHAIASGTTAETNYQALLEARGATDFNGFTNPDRMGYTGVVPPEELPFALWVHADRLGRRETLMTEASLERHRRIVMQEKLLRLEDAAYGASGRMMFRYLFPKTHPLHEGVIGTSATMSGITLADANTFARTCLVPNNAMLVVAGRFTVPETMAAIEATLGRLPRGPEPIPLGEAPKLTKTMSQLISEDVARKPRVTRAWALPLARSNDAFALSLGAALLPVYTDGLIGMRVESDYFSTGAGGVFALAVTTPHPLDPAEPTSNAEAVLRNLTFAPLPADVVAASYHLIDLQILGSLSSMPSRVQTVSRLFHEGEGAAALPSLDRHWRFSPERLHGDTSELLKGAHLVLESKPVRPLPKPPERRR